MPSRRSADSEVANTWRPTGPSSSRAVSPRAPLSSRYDMSPKGVRSIIIAAVLLCSTIILVAARNGAADLLVKPGHQFEAAARSPEQPPAHTVSSAANNNSSLASPRDTCAESEPPVTRIKALVLIPGRGPPINGPGVVLIKVRPPRSASASLAIALRAVTGIRVIHSTRARSVSRLVGEDTLNVYCGVGLSGRAARSSTLEHRRTPPCRPMVSRSR